MTDPPQTPTPPDRPDEHATRPRVRRSPAELLRRAGAGRIVIGIVGIIVLFGPAMAWVLGSRATAIENRPFAARPTLSQGFHISDQATSFFTDRLPIRGDAVRFRRNVSQKVFGEPPQAAATGGPIGAGSAAGSGTQYVQSRAQQVIDGRDGWLFYGDDFVRACRPEQSLADAMEQVRRLVGALRAAGKRTVFTVMPDKSTIERSFLPGDLPERKCALSEKDRRHAALRALGLPEYLDMTDVLDRLRTQIGAPVYVPTDTHITTRGSAEYVRAVVERLDPDAAATARLVRQSKPLAYTGDLSVIAGQPKQVSEPTLLYERPGVTRRPEEVAQPLPEYFVTRERAVGTARRPVVPGRTVWYGDSFTQRALPNIGAFFRDVWRVPELSQPAAINAPATATNILIDQIRAARNVVIEQTERLALGRTQGSILDPSVVDQIVRALQQDPGTG